MSIDSLKTTDVLRKEGMSTGEAAPRRFTWEKLFDSASERLELVKRVRAADTEGKIITQVQDMLLAIARKEKVDFDTFKDLVASVGVEVEMHEDLAEEKKETAEAMTTPEVALSETPPEQKTVAPEVLGTPRPAPVFGEEAPKKAPAQEPLIETPVVTQTETKEEPQAPAIDVDPAREMVDDTPENVIKFVRGLYPNLSNQEYDEIVNAYMKVK